ncbi:MAG: hypothetical protein HQK72_12810 [Desulfamplus sp.]|nr:hypothetical protein [Desulfamplus sp.]
MAKEGEDTLIFFCEDCGTRNRLTDENVKDGIVTFRCNTCNYLNSYPLPGTTRQPTMNVSPKQNRNIESAKQNISKC